MVCVLFLSGHPLLLSAVCVGLSKSSGRSIATRLIILLNNIILLHRGVQEVSQERLFSTRKASHD
jgi:hypothetical protein